MTTTQYLTAAAVTMALLLTTAFVVARASNCEEGMGRGHHGKWHGEGRDKDFMLGRIERMMGRIGVDDAQRDEIHTIIEVHRPTLRELREDFHGARAALKDILVEGAADQAAVDALADAQGENAARMTREMAAMMADVSAVLSDEQRAELGEIMARRSRRGPMADE